MKPSGFKTLVAHGSPSPGPSSNESEVAADDEGVETEGVGQDDEDGEDNKDELGYLETDGSASLVCRMPHNNEYFVC